MILDVPLLRTRKSEMSAHAAALAVDLAAPKGEVVPLSAAVSRMTTTAEEENPEISASA